MMSCASIDNVRVCTERGTEKTISTTTESTRGCHPAPVDRLELNMVAARLGSLKGLVSKVNGCAVGATVNGQTISVPRGAQLLLPRFRKRFPSLY